MSRSNKEIRDAEISALVLEYQKDKDETKFFKLMQEFEMLFYAISWKYHDYCFETFKNFVDILKSEFFLQVMEYDPSKSETFSVYICNKLYQISLNFGRKMNTCRKVKNIETPGYDVSQSLYSMVLDEAMESVLDTRDKEMLRMYYISGFNQNQIAESLGMAQCSVSYTLKTARRKLERFLSGQEGLLDEES
jgi:RNA polymerase sigma factor (sigma-70 family)